MQSRNTNLKKKRQSKLPWIILALIFLHIHTFYQNLFYVKSQPYHFHVSEKLDPFPPLSARRILHYQVHKLGLFISGPGALVLQIGLKMQSLVT